MKVLLTGATGYIGRRLLPILLEEGHHVICAVRDRNRLHLTEFLDQVEIIEVDLLQKIPEHIKCVNFDIAYYLVHSMSNRVGNFASQEIQSAQNFRNWAEHAGSKQIIFLTSLIPHTLQLSQHFSSRQAVEEILKNSTVPLTALRAAIVVGSGSAPFEIIRDLVEKLPIFIPAPHWINKKCQPIAIRDILNLLYLVAGNTTCINKTFEVGGPDVLSYKEMILGYAKTRDLVRIVVALPVFHMGFAAWGLSFLTSVPMQLATNLVHSMHYDVYCNENELETILDYKTLCYTEAVESALTNLETGNVLSSWRDRSSLVPKKTKHSIMVPRGGSLFDKKVAVVPFDHLETVLDRIWTIGSGERGWYYANSLWEIRAFLDKLIGGPGTRGGRTSSQFLYPGLVVGFWRVLIADRTNKKLLLSAELLLPGEAWLEFEVVETSDSFLLIQTATFRPKGILGRTYWLAMLPFHFFLFNGMLKALTRK